MNLFLKNARLKAHLSQEKLAEIIGTNAVSIWRWEQGTIPSRPFQQRLCLLFHLSPAELGWPGSSPMEGFLSPNDPLLPELTLPFIGRRRFLHALQAQLCKPGHQQQILGVSGLPGSGKTAALRSFVATPWVKKRYDLLLWATLGSDIQPLQAFQHWADLFHVQPLPSSLIEAQAFLRQEIGGRRSLVVIDDIRKADVLFPFLFGSGRTDYLLASRQPGLLHLLCQQVFPLPPLRQEEAFAFFASPPPPLMKRHAHTLLALVQRAEGLPHVLIQMRDLLSHETHSPKRLQETLTRLVHQPFFPNGSGSDPLFQAFQQYEAELIAETREALSLLARHFQQTPFTEGEAAHLFQMRSRRSLYELKRLCDAGLLVWQEDQGVYRFPAIVAAYVCLASMADHPLESRPTEQMRRVRVLHPER